MDHQYEVHQLSVRKAISENRLNVSRSFIAGVIDGVRNGCFYIIVSWKEPNSSYSKRHINWEGCFTLSTESLKNSYLLFDLLRFVFKLPSTVRLPKATPS